MQTVQMSREEIAARTGRFAGLQPMEFMKNDTTVSQAAKDIILALKLMPVVLERTHSAFGNDAPIYNAAGLTMFISIMPPGQGPCLHAHVKTLRDLHRAGGPARVLPERRRGGEDRAESVGHLLEAVDPHALEVFKTKMGLRFDAGPEVRGAAGHGP